MTTYNKYKPSGIEWIGDIPEHWEVKRLKYLADANPSNIDKKSKDEEKEVYLCNYVDVYKNETIHSNMDFMKATASNDQISKFILKQGDVILTKDSESANDIGIPALVTESFDNVVCGYHLTHITPKDIQGEYLFRQFQCRFQQSYFEVSANGVTRFGLGTEKFTSALVVIPEKSEQTAIATYLDRKTAEIDRIIANKKKLIALYEEEKQTIINHAVTRGVDKNVKLKPSGVEWLGDIPEHWEVKKLKTLVTKIGSGVTPSGGASVYKLEGIPLLRSQNVHFDGLRLDDVAYITEEIDNSMSNSRIQENDVLLNITGASIGRCFYVPIDFGRGNVNQHVCIIRPKLDKIVTKFLYYILRSNVGQTQIDLQQTGANRDGLNFEQLKNFVIPSLELNEQLSIVTNIENECSRLDTLIDKFKNLIELFQEYRTTLISEVVTGKVKVIE